PDGSRAGAVIVNTGDYQHRSLIDVESIAYHEGIPGHHMQIAIAQTLPELPIFRQQSGYTAYSEGWALYAESLGKEIGFYRTHIRITVGFPRSCCARCDWCWIRGCITNTGPANRWWTISTCTLRKMSPRSRTRRIATSLFQRKLWDTSWDSSIFNGFDDKLRPNWAAVTTCALFMMR